MVREECFTLLCRRCLQTVHTINMFEFHLILREVYFMYQSIILLKFFQQHINQNIKFYIFNSLLNISSFDSPRFDEKFYEEYKINVYLNLLLSSI